MRPWLLLIYKVPNDPSARRVYVWRKLKKLGMLLLQDSVWILPSTPQNREKLQWLAAEIREMEGGEASLWEAEDVFVGQGRDFVQAFTEQVNKLYQEILSALDMPEIDENLLSKQYQTARLQDYFNSELGEEVGKRLIQRRGETEE